MLQRVVLLSSPTPAALFSKRGFFFNSAAARSSCGGPDASICIVRRNINNRLPTRMNIADNIINNATITNVSSVKMSPLRIHNQTSTYRKQYYQYFHCRQYSSSSSNNASKQISVQSATKTSGNVRKRGIATNNSNSNSNHCTRSTALSINNNSDTASGGNSNYSSVSNNTPTTSTSNASTKYFTTKINQDHPPPSIESQLSQLRAEIANLTYLMKQSSSQQLETQSLSRRAEARAYIIENKLMDIQSHVVKIPALENLATNLRQFMKSYSVSDAFRSVNTKYVVWVLLGSTVVFWQYRNHMYERTSEEVANVAALTLQQDSLRKTIQETLTTVANSPETLASLSSLFQKLISEERTEQHLINLIVRALNSEGVRDAAIRLLDVCFRNPDLMVQAGEFLKVAANATVLDEGVQRSAGVGIQQALKSAVLPWWAKNLGESTSTTSRGNNAKDSRIIAESVGDSYNNRDDVVVDVHQEPEEVLFGKSVVSERRELNQQNAIEVTQEDMQPSM